MKGRPLSGTGHAHAGLSMFVVNKSAIIESNVPARLDQLPWSLWHWRIVIALGITWLLDGLETTLGGALVGILKKIPAHLASERFANRPKRERLPGGRGSGGCVFFGYATDQFGRKRLFFITLGLYLIATAATAFSWNFWSFCLFRSLTGAGIGGEYAAINSAVDELIPARVRGHVDLVINATFWIGAFLGALGSVLLLYLKSIPPTLSWRFVFGIGAVLGLGVLADAALRA